MWPRVIVEDVMRHQYEFAKTHWIYNSGPSGGRYWEALEVAESSAPTLMVNCVQMARIWSLLCKTLGVAGTTTARVPLTPNSGGFVVNSWLVLWSPSQQDRNIKPRNFWSSLSPAYVFADHTVGVFVDSDGASYCVDPMFSYFVQGEPSVEKQWDLGKQQPEDPVFGYKYFIASADYVVLDLGKSEADGAGIEWKQYQYVPRTTATVFTTSESGGSGQSMLGELVTITAEINSSEGGPASGGTVVFLDEKTPIGSADVSDGLAQITYSSLAKGKHTIWAKYSGVDPFVGASLFRSEGSETHVVVKPPKASTTGASLAYDSALAAMAGDLPGAWDSEQVSFPTAAHGQNVFSYDGPPELADYVREPLPGTTEAVRQYSASQRPVGRSSQAADAPAASTRRPVKPKRDTLDRSNLFGLHVQRPWGDSEGTAG
jgi:hypothetical protein